MFLSVWRGLGGCSRGGRCGIVMQVFLGLDVVSQMWSVMQVFFLLGVVQSAKEKIFLLERIPIEKKWTP